MRRLRRSTLPDACLWTFDGERIDCLLEQIGPTEWQAVPVRDVSMYELASASIGMLPAGYSLRFLVGVEEDDDD